MLRLPSLHEPLVPGQRVIVFPYPDASGATLGWYGSVVSGRYPMGYRVLADGREIFVRPEDMLAFDEVDEQLSEEVRTVWIYLRGEPGDDQDEIRGHYCRYGGDWAEFQFAKHARVIPRWELRLPARLAADVSPSLHYDVPCAWRLDLPLVMRVVKRILGKPRMWTAEP
ncbi:MAG TPA: hypothetical protein VMP01_27410 [Pirellulaceae bacterium]|nr:hypothetical protein [Pirellulaceae bacterium]